MKLYALRKGELYLFANYVETGIAPTDKVYGKIVYEGEAYWNSNLTTANLGTSKRFFAAMRKLVGGKIVTYSLEEMR